MLGYTEVDVIDMMEGVYYAIELVEHQGTKDKLKLAADFFEGLLAEGRVE